MNLGLIIAFFCALTILSACNGATTNWPLDPSLQCSRLFPDKPCDFTGGPSPDIIPGYPDATEKLQSVDLEQTWEFIDYQDDAGNTVTENNVPPGTGPVNRIPNGQLMAQAKIKPQCAQSVGLVTGLFYSWVRGRFHIDCYGLGLRWEHPSGFLYVDVFEFDPFVIVDYDHLGSDTFSRFGTLETGTQELKKSIKAVYSFYGKLGGILYFPVGIKPDGTFIYERWKADFILKPYDMKL